MNRKMKWYKRNYVTSSPLSGLPIAWYVIFCSIDWLLGSPHKRRQISKVVVQNNINCDQAGGCLGSCWVLVEIGWIENLSRRAWAVYWWHKRIDLQNRKRKLVDVFLSQLVNVNNTTATAPHSDQTFKCHRLNKHYTILGTYVHI